MATCSAVALSVAEDALPAPEVPAAAAAPAPPATTPPPPAAEGAKSEPTADEPKAAEATLPVDPSAELFAGGDLPPTELPLPAAATPSENVTINLINRLVQKGVLTHADAQELIAQARRDAEIARAQAAAQAAEEYPVTEGTYRVTYIPETVKAELREQIKTEVLAQAKIEKWSAPPAAPDWIHRYNVKGDFRLRFEGLFYDEGNDNTGAFPNFNSINTGSPFDIAGTQFSPQYNVDQERWRMRLRLRLGAEVEMGDGWTAGLRIATGENNSPVSTNQSVGLANQGSGGNFSKYALWLDRAFIRWDYGDDPDRRVSFNFGRTDNPFFNTDLIFDEDLGFDGISVAARWSLGERFTPFFTAGLFPIFNTDLNFSTNQPSKFESSDKWLYGTQIGFDVKPAKDIEARFALGYYDFDGAEGKLSDPYTPLTAQDAGNTDNTRPSFAQKGNTYMALRNIIPSAANNFGTTGQWQYFGLATPYRNLTFTGRVDLNHWEPYQISVLGEVVKNLEWERGAINPIAVNNRGPNGIDGTTGDYDGGDLAWMLGLRFGKPTLDEAGAWSAGISYKYIESDALIDGFNDSDFGGGGTNMKGFAVSGAYALTPRVRVGVSWNSTTQIAGPPLKSDTLFFDLTAKF